jgi:predicted MPP superfamily phosphohydrolase
VASRRLTAVSRELTAASRRLRVTAAAARVRLAPLHSHPVRRWAATMVVTFAGVLLGVLLGGHVRDDVGPFSAEFSVQPSVTGGSELQLPPLGAVEVASHAGPVHLAINLSTLDNARTRRLVANPNGLVVASSTVGGDVTRGIARLIWQTTGAALLGALILAALVFRSARRVAVCGGIALAVMAASFGTAVLTFRRQALNEPRYVGLLVNARTVVGDARRIAGDLEAYRDQLQQMIINVSRLYTTVNTLPLYEPPDDTIKVLHISDLHLNPSAWSVIRTVVEQFKVNVVVDTGDITDWGSEPEESYVTQIGRLGVPYVYVRGNHDSARTQATVARQPNAVVLDDSVATVDGLTIAGIGDPRFTPDKSTTLANPAAVQQLDAGLRVVGRMLARTIQAKTTAVDFAMVHDPATAPPLAGVVPLVLAGHLHRREVRPLEVTPPSRVPQTLLMVEGSTGGAGLRGLESGQALPLDLSVLYFGPDHVLRAYDEISVGGTGLSQVALERHVVGPPPVPNSAPTR